MNDKERETLSAMMDGEVSEFELHQVLKNTEQSGEIRDTWSRYHSVSAVLRRERASGFDNRLADQVKVALEQEHVHKAGSKGMLAHLMRPLSGVAVAASVAFAVILGVQFYNQPSTSQAPLTAPLASQTAGHHIGASVVGAELVALANNASPAQNKISKSVGSSALSLQAQVRVQRYLAQHAEHASLNSGRGMMPFARLASAGEYDRIQDVRVRMDTK